MSLSPRRAAPARVPLSTYRLQFNLNFTFKQAAEIVPYLFELGISDLYASPYLKARPGSLHGYDISDHNHLNPEVGEPEDHQAMTLALRDLGMGHLLDIVPNHMGIGEVSNKWWMDVLENGPSSPYAPYFDIDWEPLKSDLTGKVLLPVLGDQFGRVLERGELKLSFESDRFRMNYFENVYPVSPRSSSLVLRSVLAGMLKHGSGEDEDVIELESIVTALEHLPPRDRTDTASVAERRRESFVSRRRLRNLYESSEAFRRALEEALNAYNGRVGEPHSFDQLERVLDDQPYRLAYWRVAAEEINYRRFFDINDLAGIRVERGDVFQATHKLILQLMAEKKVTGLRIDHPDGLFDPDAYLRKLQDEASKAAGEGPVYVLVEKILTGEEPLPESWPVAGTVGYEFANRLNGLFVATANEVAMTETYRDFVGHTTDFERLVYEKKKLILRVALASELNVLAYLLNRISEKNRRFRDFTLGSLTDALRETIACFPVYRTYIDAVSGHVSPSDSEQINRALRTAIRRNRATSPTIFEFIRSILLLQWPDDLTAEAREEHARFVMKFQQLSGPVMAKGVEDTSFYIYNRLISLNEVGGEPDRFGIEPEEVHTWLTVRRSIWPYAMNSSSTHDTKRSEDVRARINVLSECPAEWREHVRRWAAANAELKGTSEDEPIPDDNDEYLLYQTLVGAWPLEALDEEGRVSFTARVQAYMEKATREAKLHTSWINPNEEYDRNLKEFIGRILDVGSGAEFQSDLAGFQERIAAAGMYNSLSQTLLKLALPGVPDIYQGQEVWDFSLVDPDNRRAVDYPLRSRLLEEIKRRSLEEDRRGELLNEVISSWKDGRIKLLVTHLLLQERLANPDLFLEGDYLALEVTGQRAEHVFAFARRTESRAMIVVAPRLPWTFREATGSGFEVVAAWGDTAVLLPADLQEGDFASLFTGAKVRPGSSDGSPSVAVGELLGGFPVALLERR